MHWPKIIIIQRYLWHNVSVILPRDPQPPSAWVIFSVCFTYAVATGSEWPRWSNIPWSLCFDIFDYCFKISNIWWPLYLYLYYILYVVFIAMLFQNKEHLHIFTNGLFKNSLDTDTIWYNTPIPVCLVNKISDNTYALTKCQNNNNF